MAVAQCSCRAVPSRADRKGRWFNSRPPLLRPGCPQQPAAAHNPPNHTQWHCNTNYRHNTNHLSSPPTQGRTYEELFLKCAPGPAAARDLCGLNPPDGKGGAFADGYAIAEAGRQFGLYGRLAK